MSAPFDSLLRWFNFKWRPHFPYQTDGEWLASVNEYATFTTISPESAGKCPGFAGTFAADLPPVEAYR